MELPPERRMEFLDRACGADTELRAEAMSLVGHVDASEDFFSVLARKVDEGRESARSATHPESIGHYRLLELLGEGGMGQVWLAEQQAPVRRHVALKVIKLGMDTAEVVARFESERQALAMMDHPGIARVFDGGVTPEGRPYFVMEVVRGVPITEYCDSYLLDTSARLRLFIQVCRAVQHAHLKGVIHRDLKPSNVLVTVKDSGPVVKVIDFGVAKAISGSLNDRTFVTSMGQTIGTPAYMSPEQAGPTGLDIDSRTDVYALGIMLYELLIGALPFTKEALSQPHHLLRLLLRHEDTPTPSARLSDLADTQETVARSRGTDVRTLRRELTGDLDWIVMKAIEKDRTRRYETVNGLAADLARFLRHEPVMARSPTTTYRLRRFVRRNRAGVAAAAVVSGALVAGTLGASVGLIRARAAEGEARQAQAIAQEEAERARTLSAFYHSSGLELYTSPFYLADAPVRIDIPGSFFALRLSESRVRRLLRQEPLVAASWLLMAGSAYAFLDRPERAIALLEEAWEIAERGEWLRPLAPEVFPPATSLSARVERASDQQLQAGFAKALATFTRHYGAGSVEVGHATHIMGDHYVREGRRPAEAVRHYLEAIRVFRTIEDRPGSGYATVGFKLRRDAIERLGERGRWAEVALVLGSAVAEYHRRSQPTLERARELAWVLPRYADALVETGRNEDARAASELAEKVANTVSAGPLRLDFAIPRALIPDSVPRMSR